MRRITHSKAIKKGWRSDRQWFARNPRREYRIRRQIPGEHPGRDDAFWTNWSLIKQLAPSVHACFHVAVRRDATPIDADSALAPLFEQLATGGLKADAIAGFDPVKRDSASGRAVTGAFRYPSYQGSETVQ
jgi:hypothetical protein